MDTLEIALFRWAFSANLSFHFAIRRRYRFDLSLLDLTTGQPTPVCHASVLTIVPEVDVVGPPAVDVAGVAGEVD